MMSKLLSILFIFNTLISFSQEIPTPFLKNKKVFDICELALTINDKE